MSAKEIHIVPILRDNYAYVVEGENSECVIVDPGQTAPVEVLIEQKGLKPVLILNTHHHADHVAGNQVLQEKFGCPVAGPKAEAHRIPCLDKGLSYGDTIEGAGVIFSVIETPGHTKGHIVFHAAALNALFSGDTMFSMGCGRLLEGTAADLYDSLRRIAALPPETLIYCGHEYTRANGEFAIHCHPGNEAIQKRLEDVKKLLSNNLPSVPSLLSEELITNPFLMAKNAEDLGGLRHLKDAF